MYINSRVYRIRQLSALFKHSLALAMPKVFSDDSINESKDGPFQNARSERFF